MLSAKLKAYFWLIPSAMTAVVAYCNAVAVGALVGSSLEAPAAERTRPPLAIARPSSSTTPRETSGAVILHRNVFDQTTGPLDLAPGATQDRSGSEGAPSVDDPFTVPACDVVRVRAIVASDDEEWSFASIAGSDGKYQLVRRGADVAGKSVYFIGWDRVWLTSAGAMCQASLFAPKPAAPVRPAPAPAAPASSGAPRRGAPALAADLKSGIQAVSPTEFNIDRGVVDKILENQADLMRQARIVPVQENGRVVGVRLNGVKPDALLGVLGMQNGDVLKTINGFDMASPEKALEAYARLRTADKLTIRLTRGTKDLNIDYNIK